VLRQHTDTLAGAIAFRKLHNIDFAVDGNSDLVEGQVVSGNYFSVLGVRAIRGRTILPGDEAIPGQNPVAVISYSTGGQGLPSIPASSGKRSS
jgi:hypothetical protein